MTPSYTLSACISSSTHHSHSKDHSENRVIIHLHSKLLIVCFHGENIVTILPFPLSEHLVILCHSELATLRHSPSLITMNGVKWLQIILKYQ